MAPFDLFCPCCTGALLHTLAQSNPAGWLKPNVLLELGKGALANRVQPSALLAEMPGEISKSPIVNPASQ